MNFMEYDILTINDLRLKDQEIIQYCKSSNQPNIREMGIFLAEWMSDKNIIEMKTSGSTGTPKIISVEKKQMLQSAAMTGEYFDFKEGQTALLCLPLNYIAGKMMVVRALFSKLNLFCIEPNNAPLELLPSGIQIDFAPLVPMQLNGIKNTKSIRKILLGGSPIDAALEEKIQLLSSEIYHGFGMTETLSHIALRRVNGNKKSTVYQTLTGVLLGTDERNCLIINAPFLDHPVHTNDVVDLISEQEFIWKGRIDFVINSGGIKLFPEEIERKLYPFISERFFVAGLPDERFGEKLSLFIEGEAFNSEQFQKLLNDISLHLDKYEKPRDILFIKNFRTTESGKVKRKETIEIARSV